MLTQNSINANECVYTHTEIFDFVRTSMVIQPINLTISMETQNIYQVVMTKLAKFLLIRNFIIDLSRTKFVETSSR